MSSILSPSFRLSSLTLALTGCAGA